MSNDFEWVPERFRPLRPLQVQLLDKLVGSEHRIEVVAAPTGVGKSLLAWSYARVMGARAVILTSTRGLQDQYTEDFEAAGLLDVRGMGNYPCKLLDAPAMCDMGPCLDGEQCVYRDSGCHYFDRVRAAREADIVSTNYAFWFCVAPQTLVLTADFRWVTAGSLQAGDLLAGVEEYPRGGLPRGGRKRQWRKSTVEATDRKKLFSYKLTFASGTVVVASAKHRWLVQHARGKTNWISTENLRVNCSAVKRVLDRPGPVDTWAAGYVSAALDGEGHLCRTSKPVGYQLGFSQRQSSSMVGSYMAALERLGLTAKPYPRPAKRNEHGDMVVIRECSQRGILEILSKARPGRLLPKLNWDELGGVVGERDMLIAKEPVGIQEVVTLATSTRTFIAEGLVTHNSHPGDTLGPRDILILDEGHAVAAEVTKHAGVSFSGKEVELTGDMADWSLEQWQSWAMEKRDQGMAMLADPARLTSRDRKLLRGMVSRFHALATGPGDWAWDLLAGKFVKFEPISPAPYVEASLFRGIPKVLIMSATIRPAHLKELGVEQFGYYETLSPFPVATRPIYQLEIGMRVTAKTSPVNLEYWVGKIDQIIATRLDRKGLIHTVSYDRARFLKEHSRFGKYMLVHASEDTRWTVERFKKQPAPVILVSPSIHTGYDFPYDQADWQIIAKVPFPDCRFGIAAARKAADPQYPMRTAAATLVQMSGRIVRGRGDSGETFITDDSVGWFYGHHKPYFPRFWRDSFQKINMIPPPPPRSGPSDLVFWETVQKTCSGQKISSGDLTKPSVMPYYS